MEPITTSCILGVVEGITEFLPVSSTGHLVIASSLLGITGEKAATFEVVIQVGAMLAVIALYWRKFFGLLVPRGDSRLSGLRGIGLLLLTTIPGAALGLLLHSRIKMLFTPASVAAALLAGAVFMLLAEGCIARRPRREERGADDITPFQALGVGLFQCLALWPGFSRSASTIAGGMLLGLSRRGAAEYSFLAAVPIIVGAAGYDLLKSLSLFSAADIPVILTGSLAAFVSAIAAIKTFIRLMGSCTLRGFAFYRLALALPVYWLLAR